MGPPCTPCEDIEDKKMCSKTPDSCTQCVFVKSKGVGCVPSACHKFSAVGKKKCPKQAKKLGLTCSWDVRRNQCVDPSVVEAECSDYTGKKDCVKIGKTLGCSWAGSMCVEEGAEVDCSKMGTQEKHCSKKYGCALGAGGCINLDTITECSQLHKKTCEAREFKDLEGVGCALKGTKCGALVMTCESLTKMIKCKQSDLDCEWNKGTGTCEEMSLPAPQTEEETRCNGFNGKPGKCGKEGCNWNRASGTCHAMP